MHSINLLFFVLFSFRFSDHGTCHWCSSNLIAFGIWLSHWMHFAIRHLFAHCINRLITIANAAIRMRIAGDFCRLIDENVEMFVIEHHNAQQQEPFILFYFKYKTAENCPFVSFRSVHVSVYVSQFFFFFIYIIFHDKNHSAHNLIK